MISIDIHRQRFSKNWILICRFVLSPWGNYRELTVKVNQSNRRWPENPLEFKIMVLSKFDVTQPISENC